MNWKLKYILLWLVNIASLLLVLIVIPAIIVVFCFRLNFMVGLVSVVVALLSVVVFTIGWEQDWEDEDD